MILKIQGNDMYHNENENTEGRNQVIDGRNQMPAISHSRINTQEMSNPSHHTLDQMQARVNQNYPTNSQFLDDHSQVLNPQQQHKQQQQVIQNQQIYQQQPYNYPQQQQQQQVQQQSPQFFPQRRLCQDHPEEEILYYCFQCSSRCICPECVIHGAHKDHEVKTIKKAYPIIKQKVEEFEQKIDFKLKQVQQRKAHLESVSQELDGNSQSLKKQIAMVFSEIKQKVEAKEREILQICDQILSQNFKEIESLNFCLDEKHLDFKQTLELIYDHENQPDETLLLDFYATNQIKLEEIKDNRDWEKKYLFTNPNFLQIGQRELQKQLALIEHSIQKIELQIEQKDQNNNVNNSQMGGSVSNSMHVDKINMSQNQMNNSEFLRDSQNYTPSASKKNQIPMYKPPQNQFSDSLNYRSPQQNSASQQIMNDPYRTQQFTKDEKISDADFEKFREKLAHKTKQLSNSSSVNSFNNNPTSQQQTFQSGNFASFAQNPPQQQALNSAQQQNPQPLQNNFMTNNKEGSYVKQQSN